MLQGVDKWLLRTSYHGGYTYIGSLIGNQFYPEMEQYTCSFAALYALQADLSPLSSASHSILKRARALAWVQRAGLTRRYTCYSMFTEKPPGLAADTVHFSENKDFETGRHRDGVQAARRVRGDAVPPLHGDGGPDLRVGEMEGNVGIESGGGRCSP